MKKLLILLGLAALLLCGCGEKEAEDTKNQDVSVPPMSIPAGQGEPVKEEAGDIVIPIHQD